MWNCHDNAVRLDSPTTDQCEVVKSMMSRLRKEEQTEKELTISLWSLSPKIAAVIINNLDKCKVKRIYIQDTELDDVCISKLSETLKQNKAIKILELWSCKLIGGFKQVGDILTNLEQLVLWHVTGITDKDVSDLSDKLAADMPLKNLWLSYCNVNDKGFKNICKGLANNKTLTELNIGGNDQITSASTSTIKNLIKPCTSLKDLRIYGTSLNNDDIEEICEQLAKYISRESEDNHEQLTTEKLTVYLSRNSKENCEQLLNYKYIEDMLNFSYF